MYNLIINKNDANYGEDASGDLIATIAAVDDLAEGAFLAAFPNGVIIDRDGAVPDLDDVADQKEVVVYTKENGLLRSVTIPTGTAKRTAKFSNAAVTNVVTITATLPTSHDDVLHSGLIVIDADKMYVDPSAKKRYEVLVDGDTLSTHAASETAASLLATELGKHPKIATATAVKTTGVITITMVAGANLNFVGTGYFEGKTITTSAALEFANTLSAAEMVAFEKEGQIREGNTQKAMFGGDEDMFTKTSMIESGETYTIYGIKYDSNLQSSLGANKPNEQLLLIASCNATPADDEGDTGTWADLIDAICGDVSEAA